MIKTLRNWARLIKRDIHAIFLASKDPRVPWHVKVLAVMVAAYAASPIDLIPDFIPVLGLLDDVILLPLGICLVVKLVPQPLMQEFRSRASAGLDLPASRWAVGVIAALWTVALLASLYVAWHVLKPAS